MPRIPLIEELTTGQVPVGSNLLVEYDPASQWYNASLTIAAGWLKSGGSLGYNLSTQPPENVRTQLKRLDVDAEELEGNGRLVINDWYTGTLGRKSKEKQAWDSLKVADISIDMAKTRMGGPPLPNYLRIADNFSTLARFNDEKVWVEHALSRSFPSAKIIQSTQILGIIKGLHGDWAYKNLEAAVDGIVDFKLEEGSDRTQNYIRIRSIRNVQFDSRWHLLNIGENFEVTLDK
ncbi:MAG: ATPase domain-containing protein [Candidatus Bathyarchaeia archaeon]